MLNILNADYFTTYLFSRLPMCT